MKRLLRTISRWLRLTASVIWSDDDEFEYEWHCWAADGFPGYDGGDL